MLLVAEPSEFQLLRLLSLLIIIILLLLLLETGSSYAA